jgi:hypothetical protein
MSQKRKKFLCMQARKGQDTNMMYLSIVKPTCFLLNCAKASKPSVLSIRCTCVSSSFNKKHIFQLNSFLSLTPGSKLILRLRLLNHMIDFLDNCKKNSIRAVLSPVTTKTIQSINGTNKLFRSITEEGDDGSQLFSGCERTCMHLLNESTSQLSPDPISISFLKKYKTVLPKA